LTNTVAQIGLFHKKSSDVIPLTLWNTYWSDSSSINRDALLECYQPIAKNIAGLMYARYSHSDLEYDDCYQMAYEGLISSITKYKANQGASFQTFASYRIRGAILNGISHYSENLNQNSARRDLEKERAMSISNNNNNESDLFEKLLNSALDIAVSFMLTGLDVLEEADSPSSPYQHPDRLVLKKQLIKILNFLPERENIVLTYHYFYEYSFAHIAESLGYTAARVSQIHTEAISRIRKIYKEQGEWVMDV